MTSCVTLIAQNLWSVFVDDKKVPASNPILARFPHQLPCSSIISDLLHAVHNSIKCPGNQEEKFVSLCNKRGGVMRGERGHGDVVASIDNTVVTDEQGQRHSCTLWRTDCEVLSSIEGGRCKPCSNYRNTLRSALSRQQRQSSEDHSNSSSHTSYCHLTTAEKDLRLRKLHDSLKAANRQNAALESKMKRISEAQSLQLHETDASDISAVIDDVASLVKEQYPSNTPQRIFWDQQVLYNRLKSTKQMRWHPFMIRFALNLKYLSTLAYRALRLSNVIHLPSERTLADYTHWALPHSGVQLEFIEELGRLLDELPSGQRLCALSMDEMKIKSGLVYDKHNGTLIGFTDLGSLNCDIKMLVCGDSEKPENGKLATHTFVFLARAIFKPSLSVPIAHYSSINLKGKVLHHASCV